MIAATRWVAILVGVALALAVWIWSDLDDSHPARTEAAAAAAPATAAPPVDALTALSRTAPSGPREPERFARWMTEESSLRGADLDGAWDVDADGRLVPTIALRRRFDQLLSLAGEAKVEEITAYVSHDVRELAGAPAAHRVTDLWLRYVELQRYPFQQTADLRDKSSWSAALAERHGVRERLLGVEVAKAFFGEEEARLQALVQSTPAADATDTSLDKRMLSAAAAQRVREEETAWADWERRLSQARQELAALDARAELSAAQRAELMERHIALRFGAAEAIRVRALLQLPPGGE